jgi:hypothetical protein
LSKKKLEFAGLNLWTKSGTKSEGILVLRPSNQKMLYQDLFGKRCCCFKKKAYACWFNFVENFFTHVNPRKLLEKSGTKAEGICS